MCLSNCYNSHNVDKAMADKRTLRPVPVTRGSTSDTILKKSESDIKPIMII